MARVRRKRHSEGWHYLAVVIDLFSRRVVGWAFSPTLHSDLATAALRMALIHRRPGRASCIIPIAACSTPVTRIKRCWPPMDSPRYEPPRRLLG